MRLRLPLATWVLLPCAVACVGVARLLPAAAGWRGLAVLLLVRFLAGVFLEKGDASFVPRRALTVLRSSLAYPIDHPETASVAA